MKLVIGGYSQGKLQTVLNSLNEDSYVIFDGKLPQKGMAEEHKIIVLNHLHTLIKERMKQGQNPKEELIDFVKENKTCIVIGDEIGNGIVPIDAFERAYRENTGRILTELAGMADEVVRVICGIEQKIK